MCSLGTSGTLFCVSDSPVIDPTGTLAPFCDSTGRWLPLLCTQNCTLVLEEARAASGGLSREHLTSLAASEAPGCEGLTMLPYLTGERTPNWPGASGALLGLRPGMLGRPGLLYRAAMESATFSLLAGYGRMRGASCVEAQQLLLVGGGSGNALWRQVIADAFELPVKLPVEAESAALGAALQAAAVASGAQDVAAFVQAHPPALGEEVVEPKSGLEMREAFARHQHLGQLLFGRFAPQ